MNLQEFLDHYGIEQKEKENSAKIRLEELEVFSCFIYDGNEFVKLTNNLIMNTAGEKIIVEKDILCESLGKDYLHGMTREQQQKELATFNGSARYHRWQRIFRSMTPRVIQQEENIPVFEKKSRMPQFSDLGIKAKNNQKIRIRLNTDYLAFSKKNKPALLRGQYIGFASAENGILTGITVLFKGYQYRVAVQDIEIIEVTNNMIQRDFIKGFVE